MRDKSIDSVLEDITLEPRWISADDWEIDDDDGKIYWSVDYNKRFYGGRNYGLFAILADVRNYDTIPIAEPRGVPENPSEAYQHMLKQWDGDAHSHSYFTLKELEDVDWTQYEPGDISGFTETMRRMSELDTDPTKVRCCFFFDN